MGSNAKGNKRGASQQRNNTHPATLTVIATLKEAVNQWHTRLPERWCNKES